MFLLKELFAIFLQNIALGGTKKNPQGDLMNPPI